MPSIQALNLFLKEARHSDSELMRGTSNWNCLCGRVLYAVWLWLKNIVEQEVKLI